jgi:hypothetical protein
MTNPSSGANAPLGPAPANAAPDPTQLQFIARMRWMMRISGATTALAIVAILSVIGYRLLRQEGSARSAPPPTPATMTAVLPKGAKVVSTSVSGDRIAVILDVAGTTEVRTYDIKTLRPTGTLKFAPEP